MDVTHLSDVRNARALESDPLLVWWSTLPTEVRDLHTLQCVMHVLQPYVVDTLLDNGESRALGKRVLEIAQKAHVELQEVFEALKDCLSEDEHGPLLRDWEAAYAVRKANDIKAKLV